VSTQPWERRGGFSALNDDYHELRNIKTIGDVDQHHQNEPPSSTPTRTASSSSLLLSAEFAPSFSPSDFRAMLSGLSGYKTETPVLSKRSIVEAKNNTPTSVLDQALLDECEEQEQGGEVGGNGGGGLMGVLSETNLSNHNDIMDQNEDCKQDMIGKEKKDESADIASSVATSSSSRLPLDHSTPSTERRRRKKKPPPRSSYSPRSSVKKMEEKVDRIKMEVAVKLKLLQGPESHSEEHKHEHERHPSQVVFTGQGQEMENAESNGRGNEDTEEQQRQEKEKKKEFFIPAIDGVEETEGNSPEAEEDMKKDTEEKQDRGEEVEEGKDRSEEEKDGGERQGDGGTAAEEENEKVVLEPSLKPVFNDDLDRFLAANSARRHAAVALAESVEAAEDAVGRLRPSTVFRGE
jgi:hypothetical protein